MVDPVSVGIAAAALLASKFGEELARGAGEGALTAVKRLRELVAAKFRGDRETESAMDTLDQAPTEEARSLVTRRIADAVRADPDFGARVEQLVLVARRDPAVDTFTAQAFDNAKQVNIRGDNLGPITM
ncbi:hypothetical protein [Nocardia arizonensis]|uniref:hypothetical protein n=1 Tax=Nocardia arizonensis TaxID=1141647 RepID=UPI000AB0F032|nr:hypothetical protein [Nocardia arizonensis]